MATPTSGQGAQGGSTAKGRSLWIFGVAAVLGLGLLGVLGLRAPSEPSQTAQAPSDAVAQPPAPAGAEAEAPSAADAATEAPAASDAAAAPVEIAAADVTEPQAEPGAEVDPVSAEPAPAPASAAETVTEPVAEPETAPVDPMPDSTAMAPRFDIVRLDAEGRAVIAGRAEPGADVILRLDGTELRRVGADRAGNFVAMLRIDPSDRPRVLSLEAVSGDGAPIAGAETALIAPFALPVPVETELAEAAGASGAAEPDPASAPASALASDAGQDSAAAPETAQALSPEASDAAAAPAVLVAGSDGLRVLQSGDAVDEGAVTTLQLDAISYDATGDVTLAGRGPASATLRVALDDRVIETVESDATGQWSLDLSDVAPGTYALRLEQLDAAGAVLSMLETPFLREDPARVRDNPMLADPGSSVIAVERGFTLWGIAEANFGSGFLYVQIFQENRDAIRDPNLIYPGQIFALPDLPRTGSAP